MDTINCHTYPTQTVVEQVTYIQGHTSFKKMICINGLSMCMSQLKSIVPLSSSLYRPLGKLVSSDWLPCHTTKHKEALKISARNIYINPMLSYTSLFSFNYVKRSQLVNVITVAFWIHIFIKPISRT